MHRGTHRSNINPCLYSTEVPDQNLPGLGFPYFFLLLAIVSLSDHLLYLADFKMEILELHIHSVSKRTHISVILCGVCYIKNIVKISSNT